MQEATASLAAMGRPTREEEGEREGLAMREAFAATFMAFAATFVAFAAAFVAFAATIMAFIDRTVFFIDTFIAFAMSRGSENGTACSTEIPIPLQIAMRKLPAQP
jgi:hypothetical protein